MTVQYLHDGNADGCIVGSTSSDKVGFFGTTPVTQQSVTQQTTKTTTALRADIDAIGDALAALGLFTLTGGGA